MQATIIMAAMVGFALLLADAARAQPREAERTAPGRPGGCTVARVIDGDTFLCTDGRRIRVRGVDTPERGARGHGEARREMQRRVQGRTVTVVPRGTDRGRVVGDVTLGGRNIGRDMELRGHGKRERGRR